MRKHLLIAAVLILTATVVVGGSIALFARDNTPEDNDMNPTDTKLNGAYFITDESWESYVRTRAKEIDENEDWVQEILNGGDGGQWSHFIRPKSLFWVAVFGDAMTISSERLVVYDFYHDGNYYIGRSLYSQIRFSLTGDVLTIQKGAEELQYKLDRAYIVSEEETRQFSSPENIANSSGGNGLNFVMFTWHPNYAAGYLGAGIEIRKASVQDFTLTKIDYAYMNMFVAQFSRSDFSQGNNGVRINYLGGPTINRNTKQVLFNACSDYVVFEVRIDANDNVVVVQISQ